RFRASCPAEMPMPRASWKGFLRLSLVSCPVYLSPATSRTKSIRLNQVWVPRARPAEPVEREENQQDVAPISRGRGISQGAAELAAEAEAGMAGLGRLTLSRRERMVLVEPRGQGLALITLRAAEEVRAAEFGSFEGELDAEAVAVAGMIIERKTGSFDPSSFRDRYQEALKELIEAKLKGLPVKARPAARPAPVFDLMAALKQSLAQETGGAGRGKPKRRTAA